VRALPLHLLPRLAGALLAIGLAASCTSRSSEPIAPLPQPVDSVPSVTPSTLPDTVRTEPIGPKILPLPVPAVSPEPGRTVRHAVTVCAGGDVMLGSDLDTLWAVRRGVIPIPDPDSLLAPLRPLVEDADVVLLNVEGAIGEGLVPSKCRPGSTTCYAFRQPVAVAPALRRLLPSGAVVGNVANNHAMDAGGPGFEETQQHLRSAGVQVTGADTMATVVVTARGDTLAFLGFSTAQAGPDPRQLEAVRRHVARAAATTGRVIVTTHMGAEGAGAQRTLDADEAYLGENRGNAVAFAHAAVEAGASAVIGHGPHVIRAVEWYEGVPILYSLGNLVTYGPFNLSDPMNRGAIACIAVPPLGTATRLVLRSTRQVTPGIVAADPTGRAAALADSLAALDFPITAPVAAGSGVLAAPPAVRPTPPEPR